MRATVRLPRLLLLLVLGGCGGSNEPASAEPVASSGGDTPASRDGAVHALVHLPGRDALRYVIAAARPDGIDGCIKASPDPCSAETRIHVPFDGAASRELAARVAELESMGECEAVAPAEGDREYTLSVAGGGEYEGALPATLEAVAARTSGPCGADERLAFFIAEWLVAATRSSRTLPSRVEAHVERANGFVNAWVELGTSPWTLVGCTSEAPGECARPVRVPLGAAEETHLRMHLESIRNEPCHVPFPEHERLTIDVGDTYDGPCGGDAQLAWWMAERLAR